MIHIIGEPKPEDQPEDPAKEQLGELLDAYASAVRLGVFSATMRRGEILQLFDNHRRLQDGEFVLEGVLFGAFFRSRGRMSPKQYRNPDEIALFFGRLVEKLLGGMGRFIDQQFGEGRRN